MCIDVYFPSFWAYVGGINLSITTANNPISTQCKPDVPRLVTKLLRELGVEALPLRAIGWVS
jgi:hypothetical protein